MDMEGCFIKKIFEKKGEEAHAQFVRFGKGVYESRAVLSLMKTSKVKVKSSSEFANDFVRLAAGLGDFKFSGIVLSKIELDLPGKKKAGIYEYEFSGNSKQVLDIINKAYYLLLDVNDINLNLKIKKKLPKPGKGENKVDDKFCSLEADLKYWAQIKDFFFWDIPECCKCKISHEYEINEIVIPKNEKDFEKIRLNAKRKGKLRRKIIIGKEAEQVKECEFEV